MSTYIGTSETADGGITASHSVYATARSGAGTLTTDNANGTIYGANATHPKSIGQELSGSDYFLHQGFLKFDTSSIPTTASIVSGTLTTFFLASRDNGAVGWVGEVRAYDWGAALGTADWVPGANMSANTLLGTIAQTAMSGSVNWVSVAAMTSNITLGGTTFFVLTDNFYTGGTAPAAANDAEIASGDNATAGNRPFLTITYTTSNGGMVTGKYWGA